MIVDNDPVRVGQWVLDRTGGTYVEGSAIGLEKDGALIAGVLFDNYNGASICMHVAGEGKRWMTKEFLWFSFYYPFEQLKVKKVLGIVPSSLKAVLEFDKHIGFTEEHRIKDGHPTGDLVILSMTREQCRFLELKRGKQIRSASGT